MGSSALVGWLAACALDSPVSRYVASAVNSHNQRDGSGHGVQQLVGTPSPLAPERRASPEDWRLVRSAWHWFRV